MLELRKCGNGASFPHIKSTMSPGDCIGGWLPCNTLTIIDFGHSVKLRLPVAELYQNLTLRFLNEKSTVFKDSLCDDRTMCTLFFNGVLKQKNTPKSCGLSFRKIMELVHIAKRQQMSLIKSKSISFTMD